MRNPRTREAGDGRIATGESANPWVCMRNRHRTREAGDGALPRVSPRTRGLVANALEPAKRVAVNRHPCRIEFGFGGFIVIITIAVSGSRVWVYCVGLHHGFADSRVATRRHPLRGFYRMPIHHHGFADSPVATRRHPLRGFYRMPYITTGSQTHPWLHAATRFAGSTECPYITTGSRTHPWLHAATRFAG